jgi:type I restriction enzyme S subunit
MKDSGVEWIGEIPSGWEVKKLKHISDVRPSNVDKHIYEDEIQVHLCNYTDVYYNETINSNTDLKKGSCNENEYEKFKLEKGDVIITKDSETPDDIGIPVYVEETLENIVCGYHLTMIKPISVMGKFIFRFIECDRTRRYFELNSNGVTRYGLGKSSIENLVLPIPSETEQQQIVEYLDERTQVIDNNISIEEKRIELLKEYCQSLISEVVTGKRKVVE